MEHMNSVVSKQPGTPVLENWSTSLSAPNLFSENWNKNYSHSEGICSQQFIPIKHFFNYFKAYLFIFITTDQPK